ncbi:MYND zinc finger (ZnF) domain-like protein [Strigomonas culicis]|nr:MYND zinc finger (ZnF) domain-like protein [Strigomonas culicis]|eukprot:EPY18619.1 MYND zinc finger (ZnF) domain-like protein [Strigomonas culicis]
MTAAGKVERTLNHYAERNLAYLARLPWFVPALRLIIGADADEAAPTATSSTHATADRAALRQKLAERRRQKQQHGASEAAEAFNEEAAVADEDVRIALQDLLRALPTAQPAPQQDVVWTAENRRQAHDLLFLDASTSLLHLTPLVARGSSHVCAQCRRTDAAVPAALLRCSSCKAVFYCSAACQQQHWREAHKVVCLAYKAKCDAITSQYYELNQKKRNNSKKQHDTAEDISVLEVPLEPALFFETRRYLFDHRDASFARVNFYDYFMKYTVKGN